MAEVKITYSYDGNEVSTVANTNDIKIKHREDGDAVIEFYNKNGTCCIVVDRKNISQPDRGHHFGGVLQCGYEDQ